MSKIQGTPTNAYEGLRGNAAENYERLFVPGWPARSRTISWRWRRSAAASTADIACGTGAVTRLLPEQVGAEGCVEAVDITPEMLDVARSVVGDAAAGTPSVAGAGGAHGDPAATASCTSMAFRSDLRAVR